MARRDDRAYWHVEEVNNAASRDAPPGKCQLEFLTRDTSADTRDMPADPCSICGKHAGRESCQLQIKHSAPGSSPELAGSIND